MWRGWNLKGASFNRLVVLSVAILLVYAAADYSAWATVSRIPYITLLFWSPLYIGLSWNNFSGSTGSIIAGNMGFLCFIALITVNLALARQDSRQIVLANFGVLLTYLFYSYWTWSQFISTLSAMKLQWDFFVILIGWGSSLGGVIADGLLILPNFTLVIAFALVIMNLSYTRGCRQLIPKMEDVVEKI